MLKGNNWGFFPGGRGDLVAKEPWVRSGLPPAVRPRYLVPAFNCLSKIFSSLTENELLTFHPLPNRENRISVMFNQPDKHAAISGQLCLNKNRKLRTLQKDGFVDKGSFWARCSFVSELESATFCGFDTDTRTSKLGQTCTRKGLRCKKS